MICRAGWLPDTAEWARQVVTGCFLGPQGENACGRISTNSVNLENENDQA